MKRRLPLERGCSRSLDLNGLLAVVLATISFNASLAAETPGGLWQAAAPESQGFSSPKIEGLRADLERRQTRAFLVIRNDAILCEWYAFGQGPTAKHGTASLAKAIVGGLSLAVAMSDERLGLDDPVAKFIPQWREDPSKSQITLRQLGSHTSGIGDAEADGLSHEQLTGWMGDFWKRLPVPNDPFTIARDRAPLVFEPGQKMQYSNPGIALMTWCVTEAMREAPEKDIRSALRERVMRPIGVPDAEWSVGYGQTFEVDGLPLVASWGGGSYSARAAARVGRLMLRGGDWDGRRLLSAEAVRLTTTDAGTPGPCGIGWRSNREGDSASLPSDAFFGSGAGHQILLVVPSLNLVVVRFGALLAKVSTEPKSYHEGYEQFLFKPLMEALSAPPYPPSRVITGMEWAPRETIVRKAQGSDNWPMTWADDGALYAAYGDGNGFEPFTPEKLSLGFARLTGGPADFTAINVRSPEVEARGEGAKGRKASGLLCVDSRLYLLARNAGNAQLAWSGDHGATWTWADWKFSESFGCPTFLNFGKGYAGARDGYVYLYSPDCDNAYDPADRMVLARAPKDRLQNRNAYEFFAGFDSNGLPAWSADIGRRGAVFTNAGRCYRSGITYNAALKRYLWVQILPQSRHPQGPRFQGGFGVYDAPEPWGPWTTVHFTEGWDMGPGESASFPTAWMSADGRTMHLVFSGDDCFSVRRATVILDPVADRRAGINASPDRAEAPWRTLPLIADGKVAPGWSHVGWGGFVVDGGALRTDCDPRGLGVLVYEKERFGNCQIRVVFKSKTAKSNAGVFVRVADGILDQVNHPGAAFDRGTNGRISSASSKKMMESAEREEGPWFAVNHGYEVQIMDENDRFHRTGAIYSLAASTAISEKPPGDWKTMIITLAGSRIRVEIDGRRVTDFDPESRDIPRERKWFEPKREPRRPESGYIGLQNHDPGDIVWFREVSVRPFAE